ncbi:MAG: tetratricopeptide repeat protein [Spirulina sp. SIO3F2]|nr:tetratricopeptide repeat protein [Spirulina sp. SIO3F2]
MRFGCKVLGGLAALVLLGQTHSAMAQASKVIEGELTTAESYFWESDDSYYNIHPLTGKAGEQVAITLESEAFDAYLMVLDAEGNKIAENDNGGGGTNSQLLVTLPADGTYQILVNTAEREETGLYRLSWQTIQAIESEAERFDQASRQQLDAEDYPAALKTVQQAYAIYQALGDGRGQANAALLWSYIYMGLGETENARRMFEFLLRWAEEADSSELEAAAQEGLRDLEQFAISQDPEEADRLYEEGRQQLEAEDYAAALATAQRAYAIYQELDDGRGQANASLLWGYAQSGLGELEEAREIFELLLSWAEEADSDELTELAQEGLDYLDQLANRPIADPAAADRLYQDSRQQLDAENYQAALETSGQAYTLYEQLDDYRGVANAAVVSGYAYIGLGKTEDARETFEALLIWAEEAESSELEAAAQEGLDYLAQWISGTTNPRLAEASELYEQGQEHYNNNQFEAALASLEQALVIYQEQKSRQNEALVLYYIGLIYRFLGQYQQASEVYHQAYDIARDINDRNRAAKLLSALGDIATLWDSYQSAIELYQQSLDLTQELGDRTAEVNTIASLAHAYYLWNQYPKAIELYQQALGITQDLDDPAAQFTPLNGLGTVYNALSEYQQAIRLYQRSLAIAQDIGSRTGEASTFSNLASVYDSLGQYQKAIELHQQSLTIKQAVSDRPGQAISLGNLGNIYLTLGQYQKAVDFYTASYEILYELSDRHGVAAILGNLGSIYRRLGQYQDAIDFHQQSLALDQEIGNRKGAANSLGSLGVAYVALGQYQQALEFHQQSLAIKQDIGDRQGEAASLGALGGIHSSLGQYEQAIDFYRQYLAITQDIGDRPGEATALNNLGFALQNLDRYSEAEQNLLAAAQVYESIRADLGSNDTNKVSLFEQQASAYSVLQQTQVAQHKPSTALETAERGRARAFVELLHRRLNPNDPNPTVNPPSLGQIQQIARAQNATLVEYAIVYDSFDLDSSPGKEATKETALYIWVVNPNGDFSFRQVDLTSLWREEELSLAELVQFTRDSLGVRGLELRNLNRLVAVRPRATNQPKRSGDEQLLRQLHSLLIEPIADLLPQDPEERVIFIPQSSLFLVPFPALQNADGDYLIQNHTILTAPSIQTLGLTRAQKEQSPLGDGALIVGNPTMPSIVPDFGGAPQPLAPLPGAEQEAEAIADLLNTNAITGNAASKSAMVAQMQDAELIHLATHGLLDDIRGIGSAIALAPDPNFTPEPGQVNGLLTAEEIFDMSLKADLVVLSACDTGRGRITGDGVVGLSRSFIAAGVPSVLVSLWQVPDAPTAELMTEFYRQRQATGDNAQALRQAMLQTLEQHPEPRNWAAFTLIGEAD